MAERMTDWMTFGMSHEEIRVVLDRNVARAAEIRKGTEARRAAEQATAARKPTRLSATPSQNAKPRIGHRMRELADIVSAVPGISKAEALRAAGLPTHGLGSGRELNRAIAAGLVIVEYEHARRTHLFASERDRMRWHLAREIMMPGISAERVAEIRAEITALDAERSASWVTPTLHERTASTALAQPEAGRDRWV
jgi:hypothetical protein